MHVLLMYTPDPPRPAHIQRLEALRPDVTVTVATSEETARTAAPTTNVILGHRYLRQVLPHTPHLQWVQSTSGDTDRLPEAALAERGIVLTRFTGGAPIVARHALTLAWAVTRALPTLVRRQSNRTWAKNLPLLASPDRALILGTGTIGQALAALLQAEGLHVTGVNREGTGSLPHFDALRDTSSWRTVLPTVDWGFLTLPHTPSTRRMVDEEALRALPAQAVLVNVGRGEPLDLNALRHILQDGHLGGAALDVLPRTLEPLPSDHELWDTPRLLLTPHVAGYAPIRPALVEPFVEDQVARYLRGDPLRDIVHLPTPSRLE